MKKLITIISMTIIGSSVIAQDKLAGEAAKLTAPKTKVETTDSTNWDLGGAFNINLTQVGLKNWAGGGQSSISFGSLLNLRANYENKKSTWVNSLDLSYGVAQVGGKEKLFKKTDDQIILVSRYGYKIAKKWSAAALLDFRTQMAPGYVYATDATTKAGELKAGLISEALAPAYTLIAAGFEYNKDKKFYALISPIAGKITIVANDNLASIGAFGVDPGENLRTEFGSLIKAGVNFKELAENVSFGSNVTLFQSYASIGHVDVNWETLTVFKVNKYLSTTFSTLLVYDDDILIAGENGARAKPRVQFKEALNIGFLVKF